MTGKKAKKTSIVPYCGQIFSVRKSKNADQSEIAIAILDERLIEVRREIDPQSFACGFCVAIGVYEKRGRC